MWLKIFTRWAMGIIVFLDLVSKVPQIYKLLNYKNADSISVLSYSLWNFSSVLYIGYCLAIGEIPLMLETLLNLSLNMFILILSCHYNKVLHGYYGFRYEWQKITYGFDLTRILDEWIKKHERDIN